MYCRLHVCLELHLFTRNPSNHLKCHCKQAIALQATFVFDGAPLDGRTKHGTYPWLASFLGLNFHEHDLENVTKIYNPRTVRPGSWKKALRAPRECNTLTVVMEKQCEGKSGKVGYCFEGLESVSGAYESVKWILRHKYASSPYRPPFFLLTNETYNVVWHLRVGDVNLHAGEREYFFTIWDQVYRAIAPLGLPVRNFIFSKNVRGQPPSGYEFLQELPNVTFVRQIAVDLTLYHMINADMLIGTGSSLPIIAQTVSWKVVALHAIPKEGMHGIYEVEDVFKLDEQGRVREGLAKLQSFVLYQHNMYHDYVIP
jgi:hypothetical protein